MFDKGIVQSRAEAKRLCHYKAIEINGEPAKDITVRLQNGDTVKVGKRHTFIHGETPESTDDSV